MTASPLVVVSQISPPGPSITFNLMDPDSELQQVAGGTGGWQIVDRPRLVAALQWYDRSPWQLDLPLRLDSEFVYGAPGYSIELQCQQIVSWMDKNPTTQQAPILSITGPVPGIQFNWALYQVDFTTAIRDPQAGFRTVQELKMTLYEYNSPLQNTINDPAPAQAALIALNASEGAASYILYTVRQGDTLSSIAATYLSNYNEWPSIGALNNIRDPNSIVPGQVLKLPSS